MRIIFQAISMALVIMIAFGAGAIFGQMEGIPDGVTKAAEYFQIEDEVYPHTPLSSEFILAPVLEGVAGNEGACPLWTYGTDPPVVGFYFHPENNRMGVLHVSVPDMRYFLRAFEGCDMVYQGYLE